MSAEILRRAAALMRERAEAAANVTGASDWFSFVRGDSFIGEYGVRSSGGVVCGDSSEEEAEHVASWHPALALEVADWLETWANTGWVNGTGVWDKAALAVARAYLGADR